MPSRARRRLTRGHAGDALRARAAASAPGASTCTYIVSSRAAAPSGCPACRPRRPGPWLMMTTRWQVCATSGRMCVLRTMVWSPASSLISCARLDDLLRVEAGGRLVEDQHLGVVDERLGQADALLVALRQLAAVAVGHVGDRGSAPSPSSTRPLALARRHALDLARRRSGTRAPSCRDRAAAFPAGSRCAAWPRSAARRRRSPATIALPSVAGM